jgi:hypothetical protein
MTKEQWVNAGKKEIDELTAAVVQQAVSDWRTLCKCKRIDRDCWACKGVERTKIKPQCTYQETGDCNFSELTRFFESGCAGYISQGAAERIYKKLREERRRYENALQNQSVC